MRNRMPCRISDSIPYAELTEPYRPDEDEAYERLRQDEIDDEREKQIADDLNEEIVRVTRWLNQGC